MMDKSIRICPRGEADLSVFFFSLGFFFCLPFFFLWVPVSLAAMALYALAEGMLERLHR